MLRVKLPLALGLLTFAAACQAPPPPPVSPVQSSVAPSTAVSATPGSQVSPSTAPSTPPAVRTVLVSGKVFDDQGGTLDAAKVEVLPVGHPELNQETQTMSGAYGVLNVPENLDVRVRVSKPGYTTRERVIRTLIPDNDVEVSPNVVHFGGLDTGARFALSRFPEIASVDPANRATGVPSTPLKVAFTLSHPLPERERTAFASLLRLRIARPGGELIIRPGDGYRDRKATMTWDNAGLVGTFTFDAPLVSYNLETAAVTVEFDQTLPLDRWPEDTEGRVLGRGVSEETQEGSGAKVLNKVAPFLRPVIESTATPERLSPMEIWGQSHFTTISFILQPDRTQPKVTSVRAIRGAAGQNDRILITFDKPMRGFPEVPEDASPAQQVVNYHPSVLNGSNYRFLLGKVDRRADEERFRTGDPKTSGSAAGFDPEFGSNSDTVIVLPLNNGQLSDYTAIKVYVDEAVRDIAGNSIQTSAQDSETHLATHVLQGVVQ